jgi:oxysterol-binding protein-related protein 9/10/11
MGQNGPSDTSALKSLLTLLSNVRGDLANLTIPPFFLAPKSVTQVPASWAERPSNFAAPAKESDPQKRALLVLTFWLASLRTQFYVDGDVKGGIKKPLNAFLGEIYTAKWTEGDDSTEIISEQVSHHPPITAVRVWDEKHGISANGYARVEMTFNGNVNIKQYGHVMLHIDGYNEDYLMPFPYAQVKGLMSGTFYPELTGTYQIVSTSGFVSEVEFSGKGLLGSGDKNHVHATVYRNEDPKKTPIYSVDGCWSDTFTVRDEAFNKDVETFDTSISPQEPQYHENADPWETQVAWRDVIAHLRQGNTKKAGAEKNKLEDAQRVLRKKLREESWESLFFSAKDEWYPTFDKLSQGTGLDLHKEKTKGVWRFMKEKAERVSRPFHGDMTPMG